MSDYKSVLIVGDRGVGKSTIANIIVDMPNFPYTIRICDLTSAAEEEIKFGLNRTNDIKCDLTLFVTSCSNITQTDIAIWRIIRHCSKNASALTPAPIICVFTREDQCNHETYEVSDVNHWHEDNERFFDILDMRFAYHCSGTFWSPQYQRDYFNGHIEKSKKNLYDIIRRVIDSKL